MSSKFCLSLSLHVRSTIFDPIVLKPGGKGRKGGRLIVRFNLMLPSNVYLCLKVPSSWSFEFVECSSQRTTFLPSNTDRFMAEDRVLPSLPPLRTSVFASMMDITTFPSLLDELGIERSIPLTNTGTSVKPNHSILACLHSHNSPLF